MPRLPLQTGRQGCPETRRELRDFHTALFYVQSLRTHLSLSLSLSLSLFLPHLAPTSVVVHEEVRPSSLLLLVLDRARLVDPRAVGRGVAAERDLERLEEPVHPGEEGFYRGRGGE